MAGKFAIGVDFGTQSGRAVLVEIGTSREVAASVRMYAHGVIDDTLPNGEKLPPDWALQHPDDYIEVLEQTIPEVLAQSNISPSEVIGLGVDFTACTMMPIDKDGAPLCASGEFKDNRHAYVKLWKHHAAQGQANRINDLGERRNERFLARYGGKISSEWLFPKMLQILEEAPEVYAAADQFVEAADWVILRLTGKLSRNSCTAGYKAMYHKREGYPSADFLSALNPDFKDVVSRKLRGEIVPLGGKAGELTAEMAARVGLNPGTAVAVANVDAHVTVPAVGITQPGKLLMIMGTSTCHIVLGEEEKIVPGMCGVVEDGVMPGLMGYEAGQSCVGDHFEWFVENCLPGAYLKEAEDRGLDPHQLLTKKAEKLLPGESGLIALDWWNGNRSVLVDADLTGVMIGMTLQTRPEEIYRALIEATAYGTRMIIETFDKYGVPVREIYAAGGIAEKNALMMQIYADVTGRQIRISASKQAPAVGAAMFGAVAAGRSRGGYDSIGEAAKAMGRVKDLVYRPDPGRAAAYDRLYAEYVLLHDYFGRGGSDAMKRLKQIKKEKRQ